MANLGVSLTSVTPIGAKGGTWYMLSRFVHSGRAGLSHSRPMESSVLQRLILRLIVSASSIKLMRLPSLGSLLLILLVPS